MIIRLWFESYKNYEISAETSRLLKKESLASNYKLNP